MRRLFAAVLFVGLGATPGFAQGWTDNAIVSVNYGVQVDTARLSEDVTLDKYVEAAPLTATLADKAIPFFDIGGTVRISGGLGVNVALSVLSDTDAADVTARIPHPFFFNQPRTITGQADNVLHRELVLHTNIAYVIASPSIDLVLAGGASFFNVEQDFVTDVQFTETYPYDAATFRSATVTRATASKTGYNATADVIFKLGESWGLGGLLRFSRASVPFTAGGIDFGKVDVGGLQASGGLRLRF